jgi:hypothetical protein
MARRVELLAAERNGEPSSRAGALCSHVRVVLLHTGALYSHARVFYLYAGVLYSHARVIYSHAGVL